MLKEYFDAFISLQIHLHIPRIMCHVTGSSVSFQLSTPRQFCIKNCHRWQETLGFLQNYPVFHWKKSDHKFLLQHFCKSCSLSRSHSTTFNQTTSRSLNLTSLQFLFFWSKTLQPDDKSSNYVSFFVFRTTTMNVQLTIFSWTWSF